MPRPRSKIELTLFPFMSVLCGLIAVLILMIFNILRSGTADASATSGALMKKTAQAGPSDKEERELERRKDQLKSEIQKKKSDQEELQARLLQLQALLELRKRQDLVPAAGSATVGEPIGAPVPKRYRIVPIKGTEGDVRKTAVLVEITASKYLVHVGEKQLKTAYDVIELDPGGKPPEVDRALIDFLDSIDRQRREKYLILLIHPDGVLAYEALRLYCEAKYPVAGTVMATKETSQDALFDLGVEPFSEDWLIVGRAPDTSEPAVSPTPE